MDSCSPIITAEDFMKKCVSKNKMTVSVKSVHAASSLPVKEPILEDDSTRFCLFPIRYEKIWKAYKDHKNSFWTAEEIDFSADKNDWQKLTPDERYFIEHILAFFAGSDGIVLENLVENFCREVTVPEARCFYTFQAAMENIHNECYSLMIETFVTDPVRKTELFEAINRIPCVSKKAHWALRWIDKTKNSFARRLFAFGVIEGLFFSGSFCAIYWLKERGLMTRALGKSNEWIARDEGLHTDFAVLLYSYLHNKISATEAHTIIHEAVLIEEEFICESLPVRLIGMNDVLMRDYIRFVADRLLTQFGYPKMYFKTNPFIFMDKICLDGKTNFFEQRVSEYSHANTNGVIFQLNNLDSEEF